MEPEISVITLGVADVEASVRFYRDGLGFPLRDRDDDSEIAFFPLDGTWLAVYPRDALADDAAVSDESAGFSGVTLAHNVATKPAVDALLDEAESAGGEIVKPAQNAFWGGYSGYFADPDGHRWDVVFPRRDEPVDP